MLYEKSISSPVGILRLVASDNGLRYVGFVSRKDNHPALNEDITSHQTHPLLVKAEKQLKEYFNGLRKEFDVPLELKGTVFQINAWRALQKIPYGKTLSYGQQAASMGDAKKARAVGMANNRNPISIIIPCHRVIGANGKLVGYGGGIQQKEYLLSMEAADYLTQPSSISA